jgi:hypothetical protein
MAFSTVCDRLSHIEEAADLVRQHLRREHMCKLHGFLDPNILGFPSWLEIHLNLEARNSAPSKFFNNTTARLPFLEGSIFSVSCNSKCGTPSVDNFYYPMYRRYFPENAEDIIKFEEEKEDSARCSDFGIQGEEDLVCSEVDHRVTCDSLNRTKFSDIVRIDKDISACDSLLVANGKRIDLCDHIRQALATVFACGHSQECIDAIEITPCDPHAMRYLRAALEFDKKKGKLDDRGLFISKHGLHSGTGWPRYFANHSVLHLSSGLVERMLLELGL